MKIERGVEWGSENAEEPADRGIRPAGWLALVSCWGLLGCASPGSGLLVAAWESPAGSTEKVALSYQREQVGKGRLVVQLGPDGERYAGSYLRLGENADEARLRRMHLIWASDRFEGFGEDPGGLRPGADGITLGALRRHYSRSVLAALDGDRGGLMRCQLELVDATRGLPGGASGTCQTTGGDVLRIRRRQGPASVP